MGRSIDEVLAAARDRLPPRSSPDELEAEVRSGALVVDIRPVEQRTAYGDLPGAVVIQRNVLEWRLDPRSPDRIAEAAYDRRVIVVCQQGYSSTLAALQLQDIGLSRATDLAGGVDAWIASGRKTDPVGTNPSVD